MLFRSYGCTVGFNFEDLTREEVPTTSNLHSIQAGQLMLLFDLPDGVPPAGKTQIFKLQVSRTKLARFKDAPAYAERLKRNAEFTRRCDLGPNSKHDEEDGKSQDSRRAVPLSRLTLIVNSPSPYIQAMQSQSTKSKSSPTSRSLPSRSPKLARDRSSLRPCSTRPAVGS